VRLRPERLPPGRSIAARTCPAADNHLVLLELH